MKCLLCALLCAVVGLLSLCGSLMLGRHFWDGLLHFVE